MDWRRRPDRLRAVRERRRRCRAAATESREQPKPVVALIGRPTSARALAQPAVGRQAAIVRPAWVTRDRHYGDATSFGRSYTLIDTGGFDPHGDDVMKKGIAHQVEVALSEADVVICVLDATAELTSVDSEEIALLRQSQKPVIFFANKADSTRLELDAQDLFRLGMDHLICGSALHGRSMDALEDALVDALGQAPAEEEEEEEEESALLRVAVVGRPNAGKSSLINRLLGEERLLVDHRPGTTRDPIDTIVERGGRRFLFVDTAGLRRKASVSKSRDAVEAASVIQAIRAIERAEVVVLMCDTEAGVAEQDAKVLGLVVDRGRALVVALQARSGRARPLAQASGTRDVLARTLAPVVHQQDGRGWTNY